MTTDPGDLANTDSNVRSDLPDATKDNINPGDKTYEESHRDMVHDNTLDEARRATKNPDPLDL